MLSLQEGFVAEYQSFIVTPPSCPHAVMVLSLGAKCLALGKFIVIGWKIKPML